MALPHRLYPPRLTRLSRSQPVPHYDFVLGHEMTGTIHEVGEGVSKFNQGDLVVSPFTVNWCVSP